MELFVAAGQTSIRGRGLWVWSIVIVAFLPPPSAATSVLKDVIGQYLASSCELSNGVREGKPCLYLVESRVGQRKRLVCASHNSVVIHSVIQHYLF